jgi:hypothetical protein
MGTIAAVLVAYYGFSTLSSLRLPAWSRSAEDVDPDDVEDEGVDDDGSGPVNRKGPSARTSPGDAPSGGSARSRSTKSTQPSGPVVVADDDTDDDDGPPWAVNRVKNEVEVEDENEIENEAEDDMVPPGNSKLKTVNSSGAAAKL